MVAFRIIIGIIMLSSISGMIALTIDGLTRHNQEKELIASGEVCVTWRDNWLGMATVDKHWRATPFTYKDHVEQYCPEENYPIDVPKDAFIGLLASIPSEGN